MSDKTKPISPDDVSLLKATQIPGEVFAAFNECIARNFRGTGASFTQDEVLAEVKKRLPEDQHAHIFNCRWMDVESSYEEMGWSVAYDKPGYNETYAATFTFTKKRSKP